MGFAQKFRMKKKESPTLKQSNFLDAKTAMQKSKKKQKMREKRKRKESDFLSVPESVSSEESDDMDLLNNSKVGFKQLAIDLMRKKFGLGNK